MLGKPTHTRSHAKSFPAELVSKEARGLSHAGNHFGDLPLSIHCPVERKDEKT